ncbi:hypothetical protein BDZ97DRAFT_1706795 [Flammula alnicola]|nr:hypothetical protein BDZ97DRAFT_1706795 [Flammula alnicola]
MFSRSNLNVLGGSFTQVTELHSGPAAFERLQQATSSAAFHNSNERFDPPRCHPRTRVAVLERIMNWILGKEDLNALILWLYGPAGSGKSAIAQSIAELCYAANILLATFFFSRSDHTRNRGDALIPTLAYQVASSIPEARARIEKIIDRDPLIFKRSLEAQIKSLLVDPVQDLVASGYFNDPSSSPRLIIIDGLDECQDFRVQSQIIESIAHALQQHHLPFIFLIASRPEQQISYSFNCGRFPELRTSLVLDNSFHPDDDIRLFLQDSFLRIKNTHPKMRYIPADWPLSKVIESLVRKASSQFIYAATVMRYTSSIRHIPTNRLDVILGLRPAHNDTPFAELDVLYMHIMSSLDEVESALLIIGPSFSDMNMEYSALGACTKSRNFWLYTQRTLRLS